MNSNYEIVVQQICKILEIEAEEQLMSDPQSIGVLIIQRIEAILKENWELNVVYENSADSLHVADGKGNIVRVNKIFEGMCHISKEQVIGMNVRDAVKNNIYYPSVVDLVLTEKRQLTMIQNGYNNKHSITTSTPVFDENGEIIRVVSNARDFEELGMLYNYLKNYYHNSIEEDTNDQLIYDSPAIGKIIDTLKTISKVDAGILFTGESGTGKNILARYVHDHSDRSKHKFVEINCAAIPESLMESELFGYESGSFTGALKSGKAGLIEVANGGTVLFDEIGDMPVNLQTKLLQLIQNKEITRIGGRSPISIDARILSATNKDLHQLIEKGLFRSDLFYRLNVVPIKVPSLRQRVEDIKPLAAFFISKYNKKYGKSIVLSNDVIQLFEEYNWPGNVRELENLVERLVITNDDGILYLQDLPDDFRFLDFNNLNISNNEGYLKNIMENIEQQIIVNAYNSLKSSYKVAKCLGISQTCANRKINKYINPQKI